MGIPYPYLPLSSDGRLLAKLNSDLSVLWLVKQKSVNQANANLVYDVHVRRQCENKNHHSYCCRTGFCPSRPTNVLHLPPDFTEIVSNTYKPFRYFRTLAIALIHGNTAPIQAGCIQAGCDSFSSGSLAVRRHRRRDCQRALLVSGGARPKDAATNGSVGEKRFCNGTLSDLTCSGTTRQKTRTGRANVTWSKSAGSGSTTTKRIADANKIARKQAIVPRDSQSS